MLLHSRYVAFLDVLGFRARVQSLECAPFLSAYYSQLLTNISSKQELYADDFQFVIMSDSIAIISRQATPRHFEQIVKICSRLQYSLLMNGIPIRGAISYGLVDAKTIGSTHGNTFLAGPALIEAYDWERRQDWIGVMLCPSLHHHHYDLLQRWSWKTVPDYVHHFLYRTDIPVRHVDHDPATREGFVVFPRTGLRGDHAPPSNYIGELGRLRARCQEARSLQLYDASTAFIRHVHSFWPNATETEV